MKKQFKHEVVRYLKERYDEEMVIISEVSYSFKVGTYSVEASPKNKSHISFAVMQSGVNKNQLYDTYFVTYWTIEANKDLNLGLSKIFPEGDAVGKFVMSGGPKDANYYKKSIPPSFEEVKSVLGKGTSIFIDFERELNTGNKQVELEKLFEIVTFFKQRNYKFEFIRITYQNSEKIVTFRLDYNQLTNVKTKNDLIQYSEGLISED